MPDIFEKTLHIDPEYQHLEKYVQIAYKGFWTPAKYEQDINEIDVVEFNNKLTDMERETVRRCIMAVSLVEDKVKTFWSTIALDFPQTIIGDVGGLLGQQEVTHRRSYHSLAEGLKVNLENLDTFTALKGRINYLAKYLEKDPKIIGKKRTLKKLILFTALVEKCSLFTQFYILMSFSRQKNVLGAIAKLQRSTAIEEDTHYLFGLDLVNIIKKQHPELWSEYLIETINESLLTAYNAELNLIDWIFENGVPDHLTKEEIINILNYNFQTVSNNFELNLSFNYNSKLYAEKNQWFVEATKSPVNPDFFAGNVGGYSSQKKEIKPSKINF